MRHIAVRDALELGDQGFRVHVGVVARRRSVQNSDLPSGDSRSCSFHAWQHAVGLIGKSRCGLRGVWVGEAENWVNY